MALSTIPIVKSTNSKVAKYAVPVLGIVAVGGLAYVGYQFLKKDLPPKLDPNNDYPASKLNQTQALSIADQLYVLMAPVGNSNVSKIKTILSGLAYNDFIKVYDAFGRKQYSKFWGNDGDPFTSDKHHLITWLTNELEPEEIKQIEKIIPNLLTVGIGT